MTLQARIENANEKMIKRDLTDKSSSNLGCALHVQIPRDDMLNHSALGYCIWSRNPTRECIIGVDGIDL